MPGFTASQWTKIDTELAARPAEYGLPTRRSGSVVLASFNALKLGKANNTAKRWAFLNRFLSRFDLIAVQEVMDNLDGVRRIRDELGPSYKLVVSDTTGAFPGARGLRERLGFLYRTNRFQLDELVSDITYDRSRVAEMLLHGDNFPLWEQLFDDLESSGRQPSLSKRAHPAFLTFIRTPHCAAFTLKGRNGAEGVPFLAVNAHMIFGHSNEDRTREFFALFDWIVRRAKSRDKMYHRNMVLMADLNMMFDTGFNQRERVEARLRALNSNLLSGQNAARVHFPFLHEHPDFDGLFTTNARKNETFDHIAFFIDKNEQGLPKQSESATAGQDPNGFDYGVFDFAQLAARAIHQEDFEELSASRRTSLLARLKADVSDHLPVWVRLPIPGG